jgi:hypothetical protein
MHWDAVLCDFGKETRKQAERRILADGVDTSCWNESKVIVPFDKSPAKCKLSSKFYFLNAIWIFVDYRVTVAGNVGLFMLSCAVAMLTVVILAALLVNCCASRRTCKLTSTL